MSLGVYHIAVATNERFMPGAMMACVSLANNACDKSKLIFHIFTEGVTQSSLSELRNAVVRVHANSEVLEHVCDDKLLEGLPYWANSRMASVRIYFPYLLKDVDWCLYLDCDIVYLASVEDHFALANDEKYAVVVADEGDSFCYKEIERIKSCIGADINRKEYFNSGVMLFNFAKCREKHMPELLFDFMRQYSDSALPDQTALNVLFNKETVIAPQKFNRLVPFITDEKLDERPVLHYVSGKPWLRNFGEVANNRYRFWHGYADKVIWNKRGLSEKKLIGKRLAVSKRVLYTLLRVPIIGHLVSIIFNKIGLTKGTSLSWRDAQLCGTADFKILLSR